MKKGLFTLTLLALFAGSMAQEKIFEEGLKNGRAARNFYVAKNKGGKGYSKEKMYAYARTHDYMVGATKMKDISRFGDVYTAVDEFTFIPRAEYQQFVYEFTGLKTAFSNMSQRGTCWIFALSQFIKLENAMWSGSLNNGMINGEGDLFWKDDNENLFHAAHARFQNGIPLGELVVYTYRTKLGQPDKVSFEKGDYGSVGKLSDGMARFNIQGGKWGFVTSNGTIAISPTYENVVKDFSNGRAEVFSDAKEYIIDKKGQYIDLTAKQKQLNAQEEARKKQEELKRQQEERRRQLAEEQERVERRRQAAEAEKIRVEKFRKCEPGDRVYFSQDWERTEGWLWFRESHTYTMRVVCFVEQNIKNGERLQVRVGSVESSNKDYYSTPEIDGIKYNKGDVVWIRPLNDTRWQIE